MTRSLRDAAKILEIDVALLAKALAAVTISAGTGLTGGGSLAANRTISANVASQAEAEAGTSSTKLMTPQRTAQAIAALAAGTSVPSYYKFLLLDPAIDADNSVAINAALATSGVTLIRLPPGTYYSRNPIINPGGKVVKGAGPDLTIIKVSYGNFTLTANYNCVMSTRPHSLGGSADCGFEDFTIDGSSYNTNGTLTGRIHGLLLAQLQGGWVTRVKVINVTGYAHYCQGQTFRVRNITYTDCETDLANAHYEIQDGEGISYIRCRSRHASDAVIACETHFYTTLNSQRIAYLDCDAEGTGVTLFQQWRSNNISVVGGRYKSTNFYALMIDNANGGVNIGPHERFRADGVTFIANNAPAAALFSQDCDVRHGRLTNCSFECINGNGAAAVGINFSDGQFDVLSDLWVYAENTQGGGASFGITHIAANCDLPVFNNVRVEGVSSTPWPLGSQGLKFESSRFVPNNMLGMMDADGEVSIIADGSDSYATVTLPQAVIDVSRLRMQAMIRTTTDVYLSTGAVAISYYGANYSATVTFRIKGADLSAHKLVWFAKERAA